MIFTTFEKICFSIWMINSSCNSWWNTFPPTPAYVTYFVNFIWLKIKSIIFSAFEKICFPIWMINRSYNSWWNTFPSTSAYVTYFVDFVGRITNGVPFVFNIQSYITICRYFFISVPQWIPYIVICTPISSTCLHF